MTGEDDDGDPPTRFRQPQLSLETVDAGHVQVEDDAVGFPRRERGEKLGAGREDLGLEPECADQTPEGPAHGLLVIDHRDEAFPFPAGHVPTLRPGPRGVDGTLVLPGRLPGETASVGPNETESLGEVNELGE